MRLQAATLIEGIVSMTLLSILLSVTVIMVYNLYRTFPSVRSLEMESVLNQQLDSLVELKIEGALSFSFSQYEVRYEVNDFEDFEKIRMAQCFITDSLGHSLEKKKLFYVREEE